MENMEKDKIILTGDRPTGRLHVGHYIGSLQRRVELQNSGEYQKIFIDECNKFGKEETIALAEQTADSKQAMIDAGITVIGPDEIDMEAFKTNSQKAYDALNLLSVKEAVYKDIGKQ